VIGYAIAAAVMIAAFGIELLGVPGCSIAADQPASALRRVERLIAARQFADALPLALENRARYPGDPTAAWHVARVYEGLQRPSDEAAAWETYLHNAPPTATVCMRVSELYRQLRQPSRVVANADRCLAFDAGQPELLADAAEADLERGDHTAAMRALQRAAAIDPHNPRAAAMLQAVAGSR
jgi:tetratricopeptide (TPR) repeat protein